MKKWEFVSKCKVENIIEVLLKNRSINTKKLQEEFFNPPNPDNLKPSDFGIDEKELRRSISRLKQAKKSGEKVIVWGDYDVDGITGSAILWEALVGYGINALPFIPERRSEGYGLNIARMKKLKDEDQSIGLIITVDNGIVAHEKVDTAKELGIDVIITDHHLPRDTRPKAYAILHTTAISGAGVAWLLARELRGIGDHLGLVAMATIADMVPLTGYARALVYHGLKVLRQTDRPAIVALCRNAGIDQTKLGVFEASFILAPRLNAMGRLEHAMDSLRLLCVKNFLKAQEFAVRLTNVNTARQQMVADSVVHAREQALLATKDGVIVVAHEQYHEGVIGLVASRLVEEFGKPAAVIARGEEFSKGSMRGIPGFNVVGMLDSVREFLIEGGGHPMAAGFTIKTQHIDVLRSLFQKHADLYLTQDILAPKLLVDCELPLEVITLNFTAELERFAPFGVGNPEPVFVSRGVVIEDSRLVGADGSHLKLRLKNKDNSVVFDAIGFKMGKVYSSLKSGKAIDIAYCSSIDRWNGRERVQLKIKDIHDTSC